MFDLVFSILSSLDTGIRNYMTDKEKLDILRNFLYRVHGYGYLELSHDKVVGEYHYFHKKSGELLRELFGDGK